MRTFADAQVGDFEVTISGGFWVAAGARCARMGDLRTLTVEPAVREEACDLLRLNVPWMRVVDVLDRCLELEARLTYQTIPFSMLAFKAFLLDEQPEAFGSCGVQSASRAAPIGLICPPWTGR